MKKKTPKKVIKHSGSNSQEVDAVINKVISSSSKLLKICMDDPRKDQVRIAYNNLHTLKWVLDVVENFRENPERFDSMLKFVNDVNNFADRLLEDNAKKAQYHLETLLEYHFDE